MPSNIDLSSMEIRLINAMSRESVLRSYVDVQRKNYNYILIDCAPSLGMLTVNALTAADSIIIPAHPHFLSAKGLDLLMRDMIALSTIISDAIRFSRPCKMLIPATLVSAARIECGISVSKTLTFPP